MKVVQVIIIGCVVAGAVIDRVAAQPIRILVSVPPHAAFVEQIGGERVEVDVLVPAGQNPHIYSPSALQIARLTDTRVYFRTGMPFEILLLPRLRTVTPWLEVVDVRSSLELRPAEHHESDEPHRFHAEDEFDPHIWLSPVLAQHQAQVMCDKLVALDPAGAEVYRKNLDGLTEQLQQLHRDLTARLKPFRGRSFLVYHPAYGYFADTYHLKQVAVEQGGKQPTGRQLARVVKEARKESIRVVLVQPQYSRRHAETIAAALGGVVVDADPMAHDYRAGLEQIAAAIEKAMQ